MEENLCNYCLKCMLQSSIQVHPSKITRKLRTTLKEILQENIGNQCIKEGYVVKDSIEVVKYSAGSIFAGHFTGEIRYSILYTALIYNPSEKTDILCKIINKNKMGILAEAGIGNPAPISILLSKQHHAEKDSFKDLNIGDEIYITVVGKRYELNDKQIFIIGKLKEESKFSGGGITRKILDKDINNILINTWLTDGMKQEAQYNSEIKEEIVSSFQMIIDRLYENKQFINLSSDTKFKLFLEESKYSPLFSEKIKNIILKLPNGISEWYSLSNEQQKKYIDDLEINREIIPSNYIVIKEDKNEAIIDEAAFSNSDSDEDNFEDGYSTEGSDEGNNIIKRIMI